MHARTARPRPKPKPPSRPSPLVSFCKREHAVRLAYAAQRPPEGSTASVYIAWLTVGARRATELDTRVRQVAGAAAKEPRWQRFLALVANEARLSRALVVAAERRDAAAYWTAARALDRNAVAERSAASALGAVGCAG